VYAHLGYVHFYIGGHWQVTENNFLGLY